MPSKALIIMFYITLKKIGQWLKMIRKICRDVRANKYFKIVNTIATNY